MEYTIVESLLGQDQWGMPIHEEGWYNKTITKVETSHNWPTATLRN